MIGFSDTNLRPAAWPYRYAAQTNVFGIIYNGTQTTSEIQYTQANFWIPPPPPKPFFKVPRLDRRLGEPTLLEELRLEARARRRPPPRAPRARPVKLVTLERWPSRLKSFKR